MPVGPLRFGLKGAAVFVGSYRVFFLRPQRAENARRSTPFLLNKRLVGTLVDLEDRLVPPCQHIDIARSLYRELYRVITCER